MKWEEIIEIFKNSLEFETDIEINFKRFLPYKGKPKNLIAIDGSSTFICGISTLWLGIVRVCGLCYGLSSGFDLLWYEKKEHMEVISPQNPPNHIQRKIIEHYPSIDRKILINEIRRAHEIELTKEIAKKVEDSIIAMDGALTTPFLSELKDEVSEILNICRERGNILIGVSKDSRTHAFSRVLTDAELLEKRGKKESYAYIELPENFMENSRPPLYGKAYFVKLFPKARWFRIDIARGSPDEIFPQLACYAKSRLCPGYIYPLVEAHKFAVEINKIREFYEKKFLEKAVKEGLPIDKLLLCMTNAKGKKISDFHTFLDEISE
ncbi:MAG: hypothetical protein DRN25_00755 [Thermoplasmata archaeon]|nr:MAG: hypothetical protein DRN25_00755 [Thermoplasmata archaeon]